MTILYLRNNFHYFFQINFFYKKAKSFLKMRIVFLGSGGGRIQVQKQIRKTAGFYIELDKKMLVDPGVGSYLWYVLNFQDIFKVEGLDYILASHAHIDHCHDIIPYIDRISIGGKRKIKTKLLASESVIEGREFGPCVDKTYLSYLQGYEIFQDKNEYKLSENLTLKVLKNKHTDPYTYSMRFTYKKDKKNIVITYISDTAYFDELKEFSKGSDVLIVNCLRPLNDKHSYHLTANQVYEIVKEAKPRLLILHHQGFKFLGREKEHLKFFIKKGFYTLLSYEGLEINLKDLSFRYLLNKPYYYSYLKELLEIEKLKIFKNNQNKKVVESKLSDFLKELKKQFESEDVNLKETWIDKRKLF